MPGHAHVVAAEHRQRVVQREAGTDVGPLAWCGAAGRGTGPGGPGAAPAGSAAARAPRAPRGPARSRTSRGSAGRRGRACSTGTTYRWRGRAAPAARPSARGRPRRAPRRCRRLPRRRPGRRAAASSRPVAAIAASAPARAAGSRALDWATRRSSQPRCVERQPEATVARQTSTGDGGPGAIGPAHRRARSLPDRRPRRRADGPPGTDRRSRDAPGRRHGAVPAVAVSPGDPRPRTHPHRAPEAAARDRRDERRPALAQPGVGERPRGRRGRRACTSASTSTRCSRR